MFLAVQMNANILFFPLLASHIAWPRVGSRTRLRLCVGWWVSFLKRRHEVYRVVVCQIAWFTMAEVLEPSGRTPHRGIKGCLGFSRASPSPFKMDAETKRQVLQSRGEGVM